MTARPSMLGFSRRYLAYCVDQGVGSPEVMIERDAAAEPFGAVRRPVRWTGERWADWRSETGYRGPIGVVEEARFDAWLARWVTVRQAHAFGT